MRKRGLSVRAPGDDAARDAHCVSLVVLIGRMKTHRIRGDMRPIEAIGVRVDSLCRQRVEFFAPCLLYEVQIFAHAAALPPDEPFCER